MKIGCTDCNCKCAPSSLTQSMQELDFSISIHQAVINNDLPRLHRHLAHKRANQKDISGYTSLHYAVRRTPEIVALLLDHGADPNICTPSGVTCLHRAALNPTHAVEIFMLLMARGAVAGVDSDGRSVSDVILEVKDEDIKRRLLLMLGLADQTEA